MINSPAVRLACCLSIICAPTYGNTSQTQDSLSTPGLRASASLPASVLPPRQNVSPELRGDIYMARKMYREAIDMYRLGPSNSAVLSNKIGIAFHQMMLLNLAKKNYEHAIKLDPTYPEAINNLGTIYYAEKSYRRSIRCYKKAIRCSTPTASIYANMGAAYFARKDYKMASECYQQALKLDPGVFDHHGNFGTLMQERTVGERALFHLYLAKMYAKSGANERALIYLRKALEEGIKDRSKIPDMPEFMQLKKNADFQELLAQNPKPL